MKRTVLIFMLLSVFFVQAQQVRMKAGLLNLSLDEMGFYSSLRVAGEDMLHEKHRFPFLVAYDRGMVYPQSVKMDGNVLEFVMEDQSLVRLHVVNTDSSLSFEVFTCPTHYSLLMFGPLGVSMDDVVDPAGCLLRKGKRWLSVRSHSMSTLAGTPAEALSEARSRYGMSQSNLSLLHSAVADGDGFKLIQFYAANWQGRYGLAEARPVRDCRMAWVDVVSGDEGSILGAKIEIVGGDNSKARCQAKEPNRQGVVASFDSMSLDSIVYLCKEQGARFLVHPDPFETQGHYQWKKTLAIGDKEFYQLVRRAESQGVSVGVRISGNHLSINDEYVSPIPSEHLLRQLQFSLYNDLSAEDTAIRLVIGEGSCMTNLRQLNVVRIGEELITFDWVEQDIYTLVLHGCVRGALGSHAVPHKRVELGSRLWSLGDSTLLADRYLQDRIADCIVELVNDTGIKVVWFDSLEDFDYIGHSDYEAARFVRRCAEGFDHEVLLLGKMTNQYLQSIYPLTDPTHWTGAHCGGDDKE